MDLFTFALVLAGVLLNAAAQLLLKAGTNAFASLGLGQSNWLLSGFRVVTEPHIVGGLSCYVVSVALWIGALARVPVSVAYPMLSIGYVINALAAWALFNEPLTTQKLLGIGTIIVGVWFVARS